MKVILKRHKRALCSHHQFMARFILLFFTICIAPSLVMGGQAQTAQINLYLNNASIEEALNQIEKQSEYRFLYNKEQVNVGHRISVNAKQKNIDEVLQNIFHTSDIAYSISGHQIVLNKKQAIKQQERTVRGVITDPQGEAIIGANIIEKGTTNGVISDYNGIFTLKVQPNSILLISYIGYLPQEIRVPVSGDINIVLKEDTKTLDEVVVVGYGTQKKSNITSAIKSVNGDHLTEVTSPNVQNMLQGKIAGVQVYQGSGAPGEKAVIRVRGKSSLGSSVDPLWVVDGVIQATEPNLNPNDIESLSVLKDAAATSLYGSRATSGVIVVKTKRAKSGTTDVSISARLGAGVINNGKFELMNGAELAEEWKAMGRELPEEAGKVDYNWWKHATKVSLTQDYNISFSGGNEKIQAYVSGGYYAEDGTIKGKEIERYRALANIDYKIFNWLTIKPRVKASYSYDYDNNTPELHALYAQLPWDNPYNEDGTLVNPRDLKAGQNWYGRDRNNYLYDAQWNYSKLKTLNTEGGFDFDLKFTDYLSFISTNSIHFVKEDGFYYVDPRSISGKSTNGSLRQTTQNWRSRFSNQMLRFNKNIAKDWNIIALVAYEFNDYMIEKTDTKKEGFFPGSEVMDNAANPRYIKGEKKEWALSSFLTNVNVAYASRYFLQASFRNDASSKFGKDKRNGSFFSVSGGWNLMQENFMKENKMSSWLDAAKLRISYGGVGNLPKDYYPQFDLYDIKGTYNGENGSFPSQLGNRNLTWEKSYETNFGLDLEFLNRFNFSADYYIKNTSGLVYFVSLPALTGFTGYWSNIGAVKNHGLELSLGYDIFKDTPFTWNLNLNWSFNKNKITELYEGKDVIENWQIRREGEDINTWYLRKWAGVNPDNGDPQWEKVDKDGNVTLTNNYNEATLQVVGKATPDFVGSISSFMSYKNFTLSMNWNYVVGNDVYHYRENFDSNGAYPNYNQMKLIDGWSRWEKPGDIATHPRLVDGGNMNSQRNSSRFLEDGSYLRLRNLTIGYSLPEKWLGKMGIKRASVNLSGDNLLTFTKFSGRDPEVGEASNGSYAYPNIKKFVVGLNINF